MRLWSIHPRHLDAKGLVALWREGLLAQKVLVGGTRGYRNHPQLCRFKETQRPVSAIREYLLLVHIEAVARGYHFDRSKVGRVGKKTTMEVQAGQVEFERQHLLNKLKVRDRVRYMACLELAEFDLHPMFRQVDGGVEPWEKI